VEISARITEVKRHLDGRERRFDCEVVHRTPLMVVALYRFDAEGGPLDSYGCFWLRRPYLAYHMVHRESGEEWRTRFDVVRSMHLGTSEVSYTDLLLDLWSDGAGTQWEDEDEVAEAVGSGRLQAADLARIERARALLTRRHRAVVQEIRGMLHALGRLPAVG
jgi:hypothetical protein